MLFEIKGMIDHSNPDYILGQNENRKLIKQAEVTMKTVVEAIANGDIENADTTIWDTIPESTRNSDEYIMV